MNVVDADDALGLDKQFTLLHCYSTQRINTHYPAFKNDIPPSPALLSASLITKMAEFRSCHSFANSFVMSSAQRVVIFFFA